MSANGISTLSTKQLKQKAKLDLSSAKRQGKIVATDGTISGSIDSSKPFYRVNNIYDITQLPTQYSINSININSNAGGLVLGRPWISSPAYSAGVYRMQYSGYNTNSVDIPFFNSATVTGSAVATDFNTSVGVTNVAYQWLGYILPNVSGMWTFSTNNTTVDDAMSVWIGSSALSGYTTGNAIFSVSLKVGSGDISLTAGTYYPIRVQFGNNTGPGTCSLYYSYSGINPSANWTGKIFYNPSTNGY